MLAESHCWRSRQRSSLFVSNMLRLWSLPSIGTQIRLATTISIITRISV